MCEDSSSDVFDVGWLEMREPVDHRSRDDGLLPLVNAEWRRRRWSRVLDLGCGTGSNLRYLTPRLPSGQDWVLLDHDADLLARVETPLGAGVVVRRQGDLADEGLAAVTDTDLVTASALLDLVSERWLRRLVDACRATLCGALFALSYDGIIEWSADVDDDDVATADTVVEDERVRDAVNAHQRRDKGLGPALGPDATAVAARLFRAAGYRTTLGASPWWLGPEDRVLAGRLLDGWEDAAVEQHPERESGIRTWAERRRAAVADGSFGLTVGHQDLCALPPDRG